MLVATPDMERAGGATASKRSSTILDNMGDLEPRPAGPSMYATEKEKNQDAQMSAFLREEQSERESPHTGSRPSPMTASPGRDLTDSNSPAHTVSRQDIRASAEKILYTFLLPGAEREIILPGSITQDVISAIEEHGRDDPEVFDTAKDYVFQAMERDAFPGFLRMKALGNLIPPTLVMRLILGLLAMFGAFWTAFVLIFLNKSRATRCWVRCQRRRRRIYMRSNANFLSSLSYHSQSASTFSPRISTLSTPSWRCSASANTRHSTFRASASPTSALCWSSEHSLSSS